MDSLVIHAFEDLEGALRNWMSFKDQQVYDFVGMVALLSACLDNLETRAVESDLEEISECLTDSQKAFLERLAKAVERK
jgi:hypothetical protein